jgi:hypothetical protein
MAAGKKTGGRQRGTPNKATVERRMRAQSGLAEAKLTGVSPLNIILMVAAGGEAAAGITDRQLQAACAAAPYIHPRLAASTINANITPMTSEERDARIAFLQAKQHAREAPVIEGRAEASGSDK